MQKACDICARWRVFSDLEASLDFCYAELRLAGVRRVLRPQRRFTFVFLAAAGAG
jgi:hypothetical protein